jgi:hypothetical protein
MDCHAYRILMSGYIDDELSGDEMHQLKTHLETCADCLAHLQKLEHMKAVFKRYQLVQDIPDASPNFARTVTGVIQKTVISPERQSSFVARSLGTYRQFVLRLVDSWISSLRARPVTWVTSMSCVLVVVVGVLFVDVFQTVSEQPSEQYIARTESEFSVEEESEPSIVVFSPTAESPEEQEQIVFADVDVDTSETGTSTSLPDFIEFSDEIVMQVDRSGTEPVRNYVYSHVLEVAQEHLFDDAVFVGYVQDVAFQ